MAVCFAMMWSILCRYGRVRERCRGDKQMSHKRSEAPHQPKRPSGVCENSNLDVEGVSQKDLIC